MKILIVEDDATSRDGLARLLADEGHHVRTSSSAREALEACAAFRPDALVLDYQLPDGTGLDLVEQLDAVCPPVPTALLVTGHTLGPRLRQQASRRNIRVLQKPVSTQELFRALRPVRSRTRLA